MHRSYHKLIFIINFSVWIMFLRMSIKDSNRGCCKDEQKQVKLSQDQIVTSFAKELINAAPAAAHQNFTEIPVPFLPKIAESHPLSNSPPDSGTVPVYLQNRNF